MAIFSLIFHKKKLGVIHYAMFFSLRLRQKLNYPFEGYKFILFVWLIVRTVSI